MRTLLLGLLLFVTVGCSVEDDAKPLTPSPLWVQGELDNGLKYHIYPLESKPVSIRLFVNVGSLVETEQQQGYAHFVEHMAFNGSKHFTSNDVLKLFEQNGSSFGADINAYTSYKETVYKLEVVDKSKLDKGLLWMRDISDGLTFAPEEVEKEKGVIFGEFRHSRPEQKSFIDKSYQDLISGSALENRDPLGTKAIVQAATSESLKAFYQHWYQPHLSHIVVTGGVDAKEVEALIKAKFESWKGDAKQTLPAKAPVAINYQDFVAHAGVNEPSTIDLLIPRGTHLVNDESSVHQSMFDSLSNDLIYRRISRVFNDSSIPLASMDVSWFSMELDRVHLIHLGFAPESRDKAQELLLHTLASLRDHGVSQLELDSVLTSSQQELDNLDTDWDLISAETHADNRIQTISYGQIKQSKEGYKSTLSSFIAKAKLEKVNEQLKSLLSTKASWHMAADSKESIEAIEKALPMLKQTLAEKGKKPLIFKVSDSGLESPPVTGEIVAASEQNGFYRWTLENGIEVWYERDEKAGDQAYTVYSAKGGISALPEALYPSLQVAGTVISRSGLGDFDGSELDSYLSKEGIALYPFAFYTSHGFEVTSPADKIGDAFKTIYNASAHIRIDDRQVEKAKKEFYDNRTQYLKSPEGQIGQTVNRNSYRDSSMHWLLSGAEIYSVMSDQIRQTHRELFGKFHNQKLVVIANLDPADIAEALRRYIAPIKFEIAEQRPLNIGFKDEIKPKITSAINNENNTVYVMRVVQPDAPYPGAITPFVDDMLSRVLTQRLDKFVREEKSLDYAPAAFSLRFDGEPINDWYFEARVENDKLETLENAMDKVITDLLAGVTQQEIDSVSKQLVADLLPLENDYIQRGWFYARYLTHGYGLDIITNVETSIPTITLNDIQKRIDQSFGEGSMTSKYIFTPTK
ncbi:M16 family metallopeptidase [Vibrio sonorensis]|uniref:M16 family metallopeptidase n=1 Tax=Vibrio sonorensis TaxID=1004316 RepID=UPI0008D9F967|nr:M16 family metallopeptidase [Vibrio sonorensis]